LRSQNTDIQSNLKDTASGVRRIERAIETASNDLYAVRSITEDVATMRRELQLLRSGLNFTNVTIRRRHEISSGQMEIKLHTMGEYLEQIKTTGGYATREEIWEMIWDCIEAYRVVGTLLWASGCKCCEILLTH
jgi:hypothetical protein